MVKLFSILTLLHSVMAISEFIAKDYESARYIQLLPQLRSTYEYGGYLWQDN